MYNTHELLALAAGVTDGKTVTLASLQNHSLSEIRNKFRDVLTDSQAQHLFREAQEQLKKNKILESRLFTRANPQLPQAIRIGIREGATSRSYDSLFGSRASDFVKSGSVASMFSPAGYLTELYREAKGLHFENSAYHLEKRRPDLKDLSLSQQNMDEELSTLTLSNEILLRHVETQTGKTDDDLLQYFSTDRFSAVTPYHQPYETLRQCVLALDPELDALATAPDVLSRADRSSLLSILSNISPELHDILVEEITAENVLDLYEKNFSLPAEHFKSVSNIRDYYSLTPEEQAGFFGGAYGSQELQQTGPIYTDGRLTCTLYGDDGEVTTYQLTKGATSNQYQFNYIELVPLGGLKFEVRFSVTETRGEQTNFSIRTGVQSGILHSESGFAPVKNTHYSRRITLTQSQINSGITIGLWRKNPSTTTYFWCTQSFSIQKLPPHAYLLKLNKAIRLCRAAGISAEQLESLVYNMGTGGIINDSVLSLLFTALYFGQKYNADMNDALVLAGGSISQFIGSAGVSHFDQLFNTPVLGSEWFTADDSKIDLAPETTDALFARDALLRGFAITRGELYQLGLMTGLVTTSQTALTLSLANISSLYRVLCVARFNDLTVNEVSLLLTVSPFTVASSAEFVQYFYLLSRWMKDADLTAAEVWMMTTDTFDTRLTPEMQTLRSNIQALGVDTATDDEKCRRQVAPFIAGALRLTSPTIAASLLLWCETAGEFTLRDLLSQLLAETLTPANEKKLATNLHVLAQYSLTVQKLRLSEAEVNVLGGIPGAHQLLQEPAWSSSLARLMSLHYFHQWINTLGRESSTVLAALSDGKLTTGLMASAMGLDETVLTQALDCVSDDSDDDGDKSRLSNWRTIYQMLQWVSVATVLNTMPRVVKHLVDIRLSGAKEEQPSWAEWKNLSRSLEAALTQQQAITLAASAAARLSDVLCSWFLANVEMDGVVLTSRDDLYSYFLIDNQVSMDVKTTRLAEAIAGIQLYINRALNRIEPNAVADVSTRQFFTDWEINSRYSTWGGISRLVYYPENYIDPLQRIGQTKMMDELLQYVNQSALNEDSVEDAFKTYLARFETVMGLRYISAYHDNVNSDAGMTYFVGRSHEALPEYWWRRVNMSRMQDGKLPANAWSEWVKIETAVNAWKDTVRPVIFRDRLYLSWIERDEVAENDAANPVTFWHYTLKLAFLRHDGNWSSPWSYDVTEQAQAALGKTDTGQETNLLGLAASAYQGENTLMVLLYRIRDAYDFNSTTITNTSRGMLIYADGSTRTMDKNELSRFGAMSGTLDTLAGISGNNTPELTRRACYRFAVDYDITSSLSLSNATGDYLLTTLSDAKIPQIGLAYSSGDILITLKNPTFGVAYTSNDNLRNKQIRVMKLTGLDGKTQYGSTFTIGKDSRYHSHVAGGLNRYGGPVVVYNQTKGYIGSTQDGKNHTYTRELILTTGIAGISNYANAFFKQAFNSYANGALTALFKSNTGLAATFKKNIYATDGNGYGTFQRWSTFVTNNWLDIDTTVNSSDVCLTVQFSGQTLTFTAKDYVTTPPAGTLDNMVYTFDKLVRFNVNTAVFTNNKTSIAVTMQAKSKDGRNLGKTSASLTLSKVDYSSATIIHLHDTADGVQYIQSGIYRIRLNTLLAPALVSRAETGIGSILSMETQRLQEPQPGKGFYATFTLPAYDSSVHGSSREATIKIGNIDGSSRLRNIWSGLLTDKQSNVTLFIPYAPKFYINEGVKVAVAFNKKVYDGTWEPAFFYLRGDGAADYVNGVYQPNDGHKEGDFVLINDKDYTSTWTLAGVKPCSKYKGFDNVAVLKSTTEPLDFNSACALYYWELFYYVPMMCFQRFLQEKKFSDARKWLSYVYDPNGYVVNGKIATWTWNCRPLEETTSWNANPLDEVDPDAVAQNDPTHYKVATFMGYVGMLITRGDMCYRELTRDSLNEAKMWYLHALELMGDEPVDYGTAHWDSPALGKAASETMRAEYQDALTRLDQWEVDEPGDTRTANSLTGLFLPEYNPALTECWATLRQRMFNLRHHLSIDGQPLTLGIYAQPADPKALMASLVQDSQGGGALPAGAVSLHRFPVMLERARNLTGQLSQFGTSLLRLAEHDDADELSTLLLQQGMELARQSIVIQHRNLEEIEADINELTVTRGAAQGRLEAWTRLYDENISHGEKQAMSLSDAASGIAVAAQALTVAGGALNAIPNIYGFACGGAQYGAPMLAVGVGMTMTASSMDISATKVSRSESYRRRREEWEIQRDNAQGEVDQIDARLAALDIRREAALLQAEYLETQHKHTQAQMELLQRKFSNQVLYNWMRGKLSAIYYQFFDITQSFCLLAQDALRRALNDSELTCLRGSAWNGSTSGLMAGESLMLSLAEMEKAWIEGDRRALEVTRTVSLAQVYAGLPEGGDFILKDKIATLVNAGNGGNGHNGNDGNQIRLSGSALTASVKLSDLDIYNDYPSDVLSDDKNNRRIKQVSVTLPALIGPYEDVRAVLSYGGSWKIPRGCEAIAISHGMNDSGQFQLDFNDTRYLPFEGIPVNDTGSLTLSFPDATGRQKTLLESLNDIILHIRYTIQS